MAPKENINQTPAEVSKVKKARIPITIAADIPEATGSNFFGIFICVFPLVRLYTVMDLKKPFIFLKDLPYKLNKFYIKNLSYRLVVKNKSKKNKEYNPVTNFDKKFEKFIRSMIVKSFPKDSIIGEEFKNKSSSSNFTWSIDPIDGTKAFVIGVPTWSNLIGLTHKARSIIGLANFPELKRFYLNDKKRSYLYKENKKFIIKSSKNYDLKKLNIIGSFHGNFNNRKKFNFISKFGKSFRLASLDALSYCLLAEGKVDAVIETNLKPYDIIPLIPIIKNAGGYITDWKNDSAEKGGNIIATSNKKLHKKILKILQNLKELKK